MLACVTLVAAGHGAPASWWDTRWESRLALTVPSAAVMVPGLPVILTGKELRSLLGGRPIALSSLRLVGPGGEVSLQVDECDSTGDLVAEANHVLDEDDQLAFQVDRGPSPATYYLYFSHSARPLGRYASSIAFRFQRASRWDDTCLAHAFLRNRNFKVGLKGPKAEDPNVNCLANWCCGGLPVVSYRRHDFVSPGGSWAFFIPRHPFAGGPSPYRWSVPHLVADGAVRKTARLDLPEFEAKNDKGVTTVKAAVSHTYSLYAQGAILDFEETLDLHTVPDPFTVQLDFPLALFEKFGEDSLLMTSSGGRALLKQPTNEDVVRVSWAGHLVSLYQSQPQDDPVFAWYDRKQKVGFAVMFGKCAMPEGAEARQTFSMASEARTTQSSVVTALTGLRAGATVHLDWRFLAFDSENTNALAAQLQAWRARPADWLKFGEVESAR